MVKPSTRCAAQTRKHESVSAISRQMRRAARATVGFVFVVSVFSGCAAISTPAPVDPQLQFVVEQRNANARYAQSVLAYKPMFENPGSYSRTQILEAYEAVLQQYSAAAGSWVRVIYPEARQALPPALRPLPPLSGPATLAVVNRDYESVLGMNAAMWEINLAASWGRPSKLPIPKYNGPFIIMPPAAPLPPLQDVRDPKFARLVTMTKKLDDAQKADLAQQHAAVEQQYAEMADWRARHPTHQYDGINPRTGLPYAPPPQETQRWCMMGGGRVPC